MTINEIVNFYVNEGYSFVKARNKTAQEIILKKFACSTVKDNVTLKGGIVMFYKSCNIRRTTADIDIDLIRYSISDDSLKKFILLLNEVDDGFKLEISKPIEELRQQNYHGKRVYLKIDDGISNISIKLDIGVHTQFGIEQENFSFFLSSNSTHVSLLVNPNEQIFGEKLTSLLQHGPLSTRYKDIADMFFLINKNGLDKTKTERFLKSVFPIRNIKSFDDIYDMVNKTLNDNFFSKNATNPINKWLDESYEDMKASILMFLKGLTK
ncbi:MAG: nucleotidyl transferase AbiEii/AbiGii toxin family protein [Candidatus Omnitrophota bacterium]